MSVVPLERQEINHTECRKEEQQMISAEFCSGQGSGSCYHNTEESQLAFSWDYLLSYEEKG